MARTKSRELFDLIKSLDKNEKRYFKVMYASSTSNDDSKMLLLFDQINNSKEFDEDRITLQVPSIKAAQLSNLKAYLQEKILQSLRHYHLNSIPDLKIREQIDFAQLLIERRQYLLAMNCLKKAGKMAHQYHNFEQKLEILKLEKELLLHVDETEKTTDDLIWEVKDITSRISSINIFSNLSIKLNSFYRKIGFIRDEAQYRKIKNFFFDNLPEYEESKLTNAEKIHLYRLFTGYFFFIQDFDNGYLYARKLEAVFEESREFIKTHPELYLTSLNIVLNAQFKLNKYKEFVETVGRLNEIQNFVNLNESLRIRILKYSYIHSINKYFLQGEFDKGIEYIQNNNNELTQLVDELDTHSSMILTYKIACLYFGAAGYNQCIRWLNKIINIPNVDIREDLHCFARILNLICHYELGNTDVISYYIISTYRFLLKKDDLHLFQKYILTFLKNLSNQTNENLTEHFKLLKNQLTPLVSNPYEKRAFIYFDIISWLESKIEQNPVKVIIKRKFLESHNR